MKKILIVDDSALSRMSIRRSFSETGSDTEIYEAATGDEAMEKTRIVGPDLVTLDLNMPGMDTLEAALKIKKVCSSTRIVIITANIQINVRQIIREAGILIAGLIEKPITEESRRRIAGLL